MTDQESRPGPALAVTARRFVQVESPFAAETARGYAVNIAYARAAVRDAILRGETPIAAHLLYPQPGILLEETDREKGIALALDLLPHVDAVVVYSNLGVSPGMQRAIQEAHRLGIPVEYRVVSQWAGARTIGSAWASTSTRGWMAAGHFAWLAGAAAQVHAEVLALWKAWRLRNRLDPHVRPSLAESLVGLEAIHDRAAAAIRRALRDLPSETEPSWALVGRGAELDDRGGYEPARLTLEADLAADGGKVSDLRRAVVHVFVLP